MIRHRSLPFVSLTTRADALAFVRHDAHVVTERFSNWSRLAHGLQ